MHGRTGWYDHFYSDEELRETANLVLDHDPDEVYVFFNNDHAMLENARTMFAMLSNGVVRRNAGSGIARCKGLPKERRAPL